MPRVRVLGPEPPIRGDDGRWRAWVQHEDGQVGVWILEPDEVMAGSASWARSGMERAALADLERTH